MSDYTTAPPDLPILKTGKLKLLPEGKLEHRLLTDIFQEEDIRDRRAADYIRHRDEILAPDIEKNGILVPLIGIRKPPKVKLVDGGTRLEILRMKGVEKAPIIVYDGDLSPSDVEIAQLRANKGKSMTKLELGGVYQRLLAKNAWNQTQLTEALDLKSESEVSKILAVHKRGFPDDIQALIAADKLKFRSAVALAAIEEIEIIRDLAQKSAAGLISVEGIEAFVAEYKRRKSGGKKKQKPVRAKLSSGLVAQLPALDPDALIAELKTLIAAINKCVSMGLPLSSIPALLAKQ